MLKIILLIYSGFAFSGCPAELDGGNYRYGNSVCTDNGGIRIIHGSLEDCPAGFFITQDKYGISVCSDGSINAYDLSSGCPAPLNRQWDKYGRDTCENNGHAVVELVD